jgi:hypothetical protein
MQSKFLTTYLLKDVLSADQAVRQLTKQIVTTRPRDELVWQIVFLSNIK